MKIIFSFLLLIFATLVNAQTVKIVVPYAPGGPADQIGRAIHKNLSHRLPNYNFQIESHVGAGGIIASRYVASYSGNDTVIMVHSPAIITSSFSDDAGYNLQRDFQPIFNLGYTPMVLITNSKSAYTSIDKILNSEKPMFFGTAGLGGSLQLAGETLKRQTGKDMTAIPYKGDAAAVNDILTNNLSFTFTNLSTVQSLTDSSQIVVLGVSGTRRNPKIPNVPTLAEQGIKGFETPHNWMSLFANRGANSEVINNVRKALSDSFHDPVESQSYLKAGVEIDLKNLLGATEFVSNETIRLRRLVTPAK